ncbi:MAG: hypothetical protein HY298_08490 [Verrucomicrobia bacterium]|nr:hypothetical protein [Verrucomicrobiota bacterium]
MKMNPSRPACLWLWLTIVSLLWPQEKDSARAQSIVQSWQGITAPGSIAPPDPHGAPGPDGVLATVNLQVSYFTKSGGLIWGPTNLLNFFVGNTGVTNQNSDPRVVFDADSRRFFVIMQENHNSQFWLNVAVSKNADPRSSGAADWIFYRFNATESSATNTAGGVNYGGDYPGLAVDAQALYVVYRMFAFIPAGTISGCGCDVLNSAVLIMNKAQLINGTGTLASFYTDTVTIQPVTPAGASPGNVMYMVANWNNTNLKLYALSDPLGARTLSTQFIVVTDIGGGPTNQAPQLGSASTVDPIVSKLQGNATLAQGDIWCCMTRGQPAGPAVAAYWRIRLNNWPASGSATLAEQGTVGAGTDWNYCPSIGANLRGDVAITWTKSSASLYTTMMGAWRTAGAGAFAGPVVIKASSSANTDGRWGDYFTSWPDPNDGSMWLGGEWTTNGTWSTWWAQIAMPPRDYYVKWDAPQPATQDGSITFPYTTVGAAHANITSGTLHIYGGNYNESLTINKSVYLEAFSGGAVTIGAP